MSRVIKNPYFKQSVGAASTAVIMAFLTFQLEGIMSFMRCVYVHEQLENSACIYLSRSISHMGIRISVNRLLATRSKSKRRNEREGWLMGPARHSYLPQLIDKGVRTGWSRKKLHADDSCLRTHSKQPFKGLGNPLLTVWHCKSTLLLHNQRNEPVLPYETIGPHVARAGL